MEGAGIVGAEVTRKLHFHVLGGTNEDREFAAEQVKKEVSAGVNAQGGG